MIRKLLLVSLACLTLMVPAAAQDMRPMTKLVPISTGFSASNPARNNWTDTRPAAYHKGVVKVMSRGLQGQTFGGTGSLIAVEGGGTWCITNHHVVSDGGRLDPNPRIITAKGTFQMITVSAYEELDLAILRTPAEIDLPKFRIADEMPPLGTEVELCGFGGPQMNLRHVSAKLEQSQYFQFQISTACVSGDSGGPILAPTSGEPVIIGMNFGGPGIRGSVTGMNGTSWNLVYPASSRSNAPILTQILTDVCRRYGCRPVIFPRLRAGLGRILRGPGCMQRPGTAPCPQPPSAAPPCGPSGCPPPTAPPCPEDEGEIDLTPPLNNPPKIIDLGELKELLKQDPDFRGTDGKDGKDGRDGVDGKDGEVSQEQLNAMSLAIMQAIKNDPSFRGEAGPAGRDGEDGRDGKDADPIDYDKLAQEVIKRLPPIYPQWIDDEGRVIDELPGGVRLGQTLPLRINKEVLKRAIAQ